MIANLVRQWRISLPMAVLTAMWVRAVVAIAS